MSGKITGNNGTLRKPRISISFGGSSHSYAPNKNGDYIIANIPVGSYNTTYSANGYKSQSISVTITINTTTIQDVLLIK